MKLKNEGPLKGRIQEEKQRQGPHAQWGRASPRWGFYTLSSWVHGLNETGVAGMLTLRLGSWSETLQSSIMPAPVRAGGEIPAGATGSWPGSDGRAPVSGLDDASQAHSSPGAPLWHHRKFQGNVLVSYTLLSAVSGRWPLLSSLKPNQKMLLCLQLNEVCPEGIQPCTMKKRHLLKKIKDTRNIVHGTMIPQSRSK